MKESEKIQCFLSHLFHLVGLTKVGNNENVGREQSSHFCHLYLMQQKSYVEDLNIDHSHVFRWQAVIVIDWLIYRYATIKA